MRCIINSMTSGRQLEINKAWKCSSCYQVNEQAASMNEHISHLKTRVHEKVIFAHRLAVKIEHVCKFLSRDGSAWQCQTKLKVLAARGVPRSRNKLSTDFQKWVVIHCMHLSIEIFSVNSPPHSRSELVSDWLKFFRAWVKTLRRLLFRISIMVWGGGGGGVNRKDPSIAAQRLNVSSYLPSQGYLTMVRSPIVAAIKPVTISC